MSHSAGCGCDACGQAIAAADPSFSVTGKTLAPFTVTGGTIGLYSVTGAAPFYEIDGCVGRYVIGGFDDILPDVSGSIIGDCILGDAVIGG